MWGGEWDGWASRVFVGMSLGMGCVWSVSVLVSVSFLPFLCPLSLLLSLSPSLFSFRLPPHCLNTLLSSPSLPPFLPLFFPLFSHFISTFLFYFALLFIHFLSLSSFVPNRYGRTKERCSPFEIVSLCLATRSSCCCHLSPSRPFLSESDKQRCERRASSVHCRFRVLLG